jgi:3-hydroxyacyl-[acyl-carrier-protein] dehydratase
MRWIWIDRFIEFHSGRSARAIKNVSLAEEHLHDHVPAYPMMPASLILEGLAQTGGVLVGEARGYREKVVLAKVPRAEFHDVALPGDQLVYEASILDIRDEGAVVQAKASRDGQPLAEAELFFAFLDQTRSARANAAAPNFVFTEGMVGVLDLARASAESAAKASQADRSCPNEPTSKQ